MGIPVANVVEGITTTNSLYIGVCVIINIVLQAAYIVIDVIGLATLAQVVTSVINDIETAPVTQNVFIIEARAVINIVLRADVIVVDVIVFGIVAPVGIPATNVIEPATVTRNALGTLI